MPYVNNERFLRIPSNLKGVMEYYPDVSLFEVNQIQYTYLWQQLLKGPYIYTNGVEIRPAGRLMYAFQAFKGWLGFDNNCDPNKVSYVLNKLAVHGYVHQLQQPNLSKMRDYPLDERIVELVQTPYSSETVEQLQYRLIITYFKAEPFMSIPYYYQQLCANHRFGESWLIAGAPEFIPSLNPQDDGLILDTLKALDKLGREPKTFVPDSKFSKQAAEYYCSKAKNTPAPSFLSRLIWSDPRPGYLKQALRYDPAIASREAHRFVELHMQEGNYEGAYRLLPLLDDQSLILNHLLQMPDDLRAEMVAKDSPQAAALAKHFLAKKMYQQAQALYSNLEILNADAAFAIAIEAQDHTRAYDMYCRLEATVLFSMPERKTLAHRFAVEAEKEYAAGKIAKNNKAWSTAEQHYSQSLQLKKMAHHLNPSAENIAAVQCHKRLYANLLIDSDRDLHNPEHSDLAKVQKALVMLRECQPKSSQEIGDHKKALAQALMRRVDTLKEKISYSDTPDREGMLEHIETHQHEITAFIRTLEEIIALLKSTKDRDLKLKLGKAHYLLADVKDMFEIHDADIHQNYQLAMDVVPDNPFYILRVTEVYPDKKDQLIAKGISKMRALGYEAIDYYHWSNERWVNRDNLIHKLKDIHQPPIEPVGDSCFSSCFRLGF